MFIKVIFTSVDCAPVGECFVIASIVSNHPVPEELEGYPRELPVVL